MSKKIDEDDLIELERRILEKLDDVEDKLISKLNSIHSTIVAKFTGDLRRSDL